jgi:Uncharacterized conserved protein
VSLGHPELVAAISSEIIRNGPIPFVRFMELALYHPQYGYYMRQPDGADHERIGWSGDFYTSSDCTRFSAAQLPRRLGKWMNYWVAPLPSRSSKWAPGKAC